MSRKVKRTKQILLVEYERGVATLTQKSLQEAGFQVDIANNGSFALEILNQREYDAILLNYSLPDMKGIELSQEIRRKGIESPLIVINRNEDKQYAFKIMKSGDYDFVVKSQDSNYIVALPSTINMSLEGYALTKEKERLQNQLKNSTNHLERKVEERIKQLMEINENLKQMVRNKEAELIEVRQQLMQASKLAVLGTLGAGVAHELNNPLTVVSAEADEILDAVEVGYYNQELAVISAKNIKNHAEKMRIIIDHIRQYIRDDKNSGWKQLSINDPITDALILLKTQLDNSGIEVNLCLTENLPKIWGQHNKLESVFQNLIINTRDAFISIDDGRKKQLIISTFLNENNKIVVKFADNACGMSEPILSKIFNPFFTTKDIGNGTGLGLSIVHRNIKEHRGDIEVKSKEGQGTEFNITFPLERRKKSIQAKI
ncbi:MAG: response regulator [bacterium]